MTNKPPDSFYFILLTAAFTRAKFPCVCEEPGFLKMPGIGACRVLQVGPAAAVGGVETLLSSCCF